jgi:hypothetical protein
MAGNVFTRLSENILGQQGQDSTKSRSVQNSRWIYPAIVRTVDDEAGFNRLKAEIVERDNNGNIIPGRDRNIPDSRLPICIPWETEFLHIRPQVGEGVWIICENPTDLNAPRFWKGPIITSPLKLSYQSYEESVTILNSGSFNTKNIYDGPTLQKQIKQYTVLPSASEIALQGRQDADIVLRPREIELRAGKFKLNSVTELNDVTPCRIHIKQIDSNPNSTGVKKADQQINQTFTPYSQINIVASNINFVSNEGKFRDFNDNTEEGKLVPRIKDYGAIATSLSPAVRGDELNVLLKLMLQFLLVHIHTPQNPPLANNISKQLEPYMNSGKLQDLLSNVVRIS